MWDETPVTNAELYSVSPPLLTDEELAHFKFGNRSINDFFLGLSDILKACHHNYMSAADVSRVLNASKATTACGGQWTPRLSWFLMKTWRTVHFARIEQEKATKRAEAEKVRDEMATAIGRAVARQQGDTYQKVLRNYFKNPTLGEIFPELAALKRSLSGSAHETTSEQTRDAVARQVVHTKPNKNVERKALVSTHPKPALEPKWKSYFNSAEGRDYLIHLARSHPRLLELASLNDIRFLGCLRANKAKHPEERYWIAEDAEQLRSAFVLGLHLAGNSGVKQ